MKITPMLEQYLRAKQEVGDALLMFRLGDFYELFFEDAETAARVLDITLTTRSKKDEVPIPMCGVPHHSVQGYVARLLGAGFKVALCDQLEDASLAKGIVSRGVVRIVTPGTVTEEEYLDPKQPNYLAAVARDGEAVALLAADLSTGETRHAVLADAAALGEWLGRLAPRELLIRRATRCWRRRSRARCRRRC
jgi:DNA mismatch repair protein MutS